MKSQQSTVFPVSAAISKATGVYASLNIPSSLKIWSRTCVPLQCCFSRSPRTKGSSSSRRSWWTKRKQQGAEQPKRKAAARKDWSYPAGHHPQQTFINWRRKRKVSWELHLRRDSSGCKQMKSPEWKFQRNYGRTQWRKKKQQKGQWRSVRPRVT